MQAGQLKSRQTKPADAMDRQMMSLGQLHFLASYCPVHRAFPVGWTSRIFIPAVNNGCVRFFKNDQGLICAALIWARLPGEASDRMVFEGIPPQPEDWTAGDALWFLDILAPFDHGRMVARNIARNPPDEPFFFARLGEDGKVRKVVCGDPTAEKDEARVRTVFVPKRRQGAV